MKKSFVSIVAIAATMLSVSCQKENASHNGRTEFTAYADGSAPDSKTVLNGIVSEWNADEIKVLNGTNVEGCAQTFVTTATGVTSAKFTMKNPDATFNGEHFMAISPADMSGNSWWNDANGNRCVDKLWLVPGQTAVAETYDPSAHIAVAYTENSTLEFKNAVALLKFKALDSNVSSISVTVGTGEALAGNFSFDPISLKNFTADHPDYSLTNQATLSGSFEADKHYYLVVFPGEYSSLTLSVNGKAVKTKEGPVTLSRNKIYDMGSVDGIPVCEYGIAGGFNGWNINNPILLKDYDGDGIFECKKLKFDDKGFKFVIPGTWDNSFGAWKEGFRFDLDMPSSDPWYGKIFTNNIGEHTNDILVSDTSKEWDVYIYAAQDEPWGKEYKFTVVAAGTPVPSK